MTIRQLSVFIENKPGYLNEVLEILAANNINIAALTIADTDEYGIARILVNEPELAAEKLRESKHSVRVHDVLSLEMSPEPGSLYRILAHFAQADIDIAYVYAFSYGDKSFVVLRTDNREKAIEVIENNKLKTVNEADLA